MSDISINVIDLYDGFDIQLVIDGKEQYFHFDQEDDRSELVAVFKALGFSNCSYEEDC